MRLIEALPKEYGASDDALELAHQELVLDLWEQENRRKQAWKSPKYRAQLAFIRLLEKEIDLPIWLREAY